MLKAIPGVQLLEMPRHGPSSLCCGGGGGRLWNDEPASRARESIAGLRIQEAHSTGAEAVVTACPLCLVMLEDARKTAGLEESIRVVDLAELVAGSLDPDRPREE